MSRRITGNRSQRKVEPGHIRSTEEVERQHHGEWQKWLAGLTPDEKLELERRGLIAPPKPGKRKRPRLVQDEEEGESNPGTCDHLPGEGLNPFEALAAKEAEQGISEPGEPPMPPDEAAAKRRELVLLSHVLPQIADARDARLEASVVALALQIGARQGITVDGLAARHGITRQAVQARTHAWRACFGISQADVELLEYVLAPILASRTPGLEAEAIAKAARIGLSNSGRMEDAGMKHGVCRQAVSRRVRVWCEKLDLPLPRECKRHTENYRLFNVTKQAIDPFK